MIKTHLTKIRNITPPLLLPLFFSYSLHSCSPLAYRVQNQQKEQQKERQEEIREQRMPYHEELSLLAPGEAAWKEKKR